MKKGSATLALFAAFGLSHAAYFLEQFLDDGWQNRWVQSESKNDYGHWALSTGKFFGDQEKDKDCGGGYLKIMPSDADLKHFSGETPYNIMFGPDICGPDMKKVHVIFNYKGKNLLIKKDIKCKADELTHVYTLILKPDNTYQVLIDYEEVQSGDLESDWDFLPPKRIKDPNAKKPEAWEENEYIDDPEDKKPEDWDQPETISDPLARRPAEWDDAEDGEWMPPEIPNPDYKGEWKQKQIKNPKYKGPWVHPEIDNPEYSPDQNLYLYRDIGAIGFDLWQVKSGSIFDNIIVTNDPEEARKFAEETWGKSKDEEKKMKEKHDEEKRKLEEEELKKKDEEMKRRAEDAKKQVFKDISKKEKPAEDKLMEEEEEEEAEEQQEEEQEEEQEEGKVKEEL